MHGKSILVGIASAVLLTLPAVAQQPVTPEPSRPDLAEWGGIPLPIVGVMLDHAEELGLSTAQVAGLRRLGLDVMRAVIRRQADLMVAQVDLSALLDWDANDAIDVANAEAKLRETERIRTDLQIALVHAIEAARSQLTPDQRAKLTALLAGDGSGAADPPGRSSPPSAGHVPRGGAGARPPGGTRFEGRPDLHRGAHGRVFIGPSPFWWGPPYPYWDYPDYTYSPPPVAVQPPAYIQQQPVYWYYCPSARAYYPSVPTCPEPWVLVTPGTG